MAYLTEAEVQARATQVISLQNETAQQILMEAVASAEEKFDVFLSHSSAESDIILLGVKALLEDFNLKVYVDKYSDPQLSPEDVTRETAEILRSRMRSSKTLIYIHSHHSQKSRWMPWELGFFDGLNGKVGVLPVTRNQEETFKNEEYLNLYPYVDFVPMNGKMQPQFWINKTVELYAQLDSWVKGKEQIRKH
ncbi:MAG: toll/interleukin-1 receptor domain-containing protein [Deltaproteobacteria bacterium]|nr:toll/interleukin-1 receptor domain-containing protein [Deltaproteobacteria bacterium]